MREDTQRDLFAEGLQKRSGLFAVGAGKAHRFDGDVPIGPHDDCDGAPHGYPQKLPPDRRYEARLW